MQLGSLFAVRLWVVCKNSVLFLIATMLDNKYDTAYKAPSLHHWLGVVTYLHQASRLM